MDVVIEEGVQPYAFPCHFKGSNIFCFTGGSSNSLLFAHIPQDYSRSQGKGVTANTASSIQTVSPVRVSEAKEANVVASQTEFELPGSFQISYNLNGSMPVNIRIVVKILRQLLDSI